MLMDHPTVWLVYTGALSSPVVRSELMDHESVLTILAFLDACLPILTCCVFLLFQNLIILLFYLVVAFGWLFGHFPYSQFTCSKAFWELCVSSEDMPSLSFFFSLPYPLRTLSLLTPLFYPWVGVDYFRYTSCCQLLLFIVPLHAPTKYQELLVLKPASHPKTYSTFPLDHYIT